MVPLLEAVGIRRTHVLALDGWTGPWEATPALDVSGLAERLQEDAVVLLDVREDDEWESGHVEGSVHAPYHELRDEVPDLPDGKPVAVACAAGNRSSLATSLLRRHGVDRVVHVADGGVADLEDEGISLVGG